MMVSYLPPGHQSPLPSSPYNGHFCILSLLLLLPFIYCIRSRFGGTFPFVWRPGGQVLSDNCVGQRLLSRFTH